MIHGGVLFILLIAALLAQELTPSIAAVIDALAGGLQEDLLHRARPLFLPAFFFAALLTVSFPGMLALAFACGVAWDAVNALVWGEGSPGFGSGPLLFGLFGSIMHGARPLFARGRWLVPVLLAGACVFFLLLMEYLWINFRAGDFQFPSGFWMKTVMSTLLTTFVFPVFLFLAARSRSAFGFQTGEPGLPPR